MKLYETKEFKIGLAIVAALVLIIFVVSSMPPKATEGTVVLKDEKGNPIKDESGNQVQFNPRSYTDALSSMIYSYAYGFRDTAIMKTLLSLSNAQLLAVAEDWNKRYYGTDKESLISAIGKEYYIYSEDSANQKALIQKLQSLNVGRVKMT